MDVRWLAVANGPNIFQMLLVIKLIIIIKNVLIIVTIHTKVLQGHFAQINAKTLQMLRNNHTIGRTVTSLEAAGRSEETVHL